MKSDNDMTPAIPFRVAGSPSGNVLRHAPPEENERQAENGAFASPGAEPLPAARVQPWVPSATKLPTLQQRGAVSEQFRRLRARLFEYRGFHSLKTVLISSALSREGKSFVAANLAVSLNQHRGARVLLIDGDLRRYTLQNYFGIAHKPGLAEFLTGKATTAEILYRPDAATVAAHPGVAHLTLIPGGDGGDQVADLSEDSRFADLLAGVAPHFDWVIVDSSPVTIVSDAVNMARHCDGVLLVVREGVTRYPTAQRAQKEFASSRLLGVVLNGSTGEPVSYYGYGSREE